MCLTIQLRSLSLPSLTPYWSARCLPRAARISFIGLFELFGRKQGLVRNAAGKGNHVRPIQ